MNERKLAEWRNEYIHTYMKDRVNKWMMIDSEHRPVLLDTP